MNGSLGGYSLSSLRLSRPCDGLQALTCSSLVDGAINGLIRTQIYTLSASANDSYQVRLLRPNATSLFTPRLDIYDHTGASIQFVNTTDLAQVKFTVPADGTYTVVVADSFDNSQSGSYSLSMLRLNRPCNAGTLSCGAPAAGNLPRALASSVYAYSAAAGESFSVRMLLTSGTPQPDIQVYDSLGNTVGQPLSGNFAGVDVVNPAAGNYTVLAIDDSKTPSPSGFTLDLLRTVNACAVPATQGATVNGVVSAAAPFLAYRIAASSGDMLSLRSSSSTAGFASQMELYDPTGVRLDSGVFSLSRKAAASGNYTVILGAAAPRTGGRIQFRLAASEQARRHLAPRLRRFHAGAARAVQSVPLLRARRQHRRRPAAPLHAHQRQFLAADGSLRSLGSAHRGQFRCHPDRRRCRQLSGSSEPLDQAIETGTYSVAFQRPNNPCSPVSLTCGQTTLRQVNTPGQLDTFSFSATGGDQTTIQLAARTGAYSPFVEMYNPAGALLSSSSNGLLRRALPAERRLHAPGARY